MSRDIIRKFFKLCLGVLGAQLAFGVAAVDKGEVAADFSLPTSNGSIHLYETQARLIYVDFWASWCGPCKLSFPWMIEMQRKYGSKGLTIIAINLDKDANKAREFLGQSQPNFTLAFDRIGDTPRAFGLKAMPTSYLLGADKKIIKVHTGFRKEDREQLESTIRNALGNFE